MRRASTLSAYLQVVPLTLVFVAFLLVPILAIVVVSFGDYTEYSLVPDLVLTNYCDVLFSTVTYTTYRNTLKFALLTWALTLPIGFIVAYFLAFHVRTFVWQLTLFLICTVPFLTSNSIRMISWIPFLGYHGIFNALLQAMVGSRGPWSSCCFPISPSCGPSCTFIPCSWGSPLQLHDAHRSCPSRRRLRGQPLAGGQGSGDAVVEAGYGDW